MRLKLLFISVWLGYAFSFAQEIVWNPKESFTTDAILSKSNGSPLTIHINDIIQVIDSVEVPTWATLNFGDEGEFVIENEQTRLVIKGLIFAERKKIFNLSKKGVTSYKFESVSNIKLEGAKTYYPEWWGVFPNIIPGQNGDTQPKQIHHTYLKEMMLDVASSGGGTIKFSEGTYYIRDIVIDSDNISVIGEGKNTILRFDRSNYGYSTRRGGIFTIQGPTLEKYYSKIFTEGASIAGNFLYDKEQKTIQNILVKDLMIEWNEDSAKEDPSMNGLTIVNAKNVIIDNVHVNLFGANRAFYIGAIFEGDTTENITIKNSSGINSRTGVFILHGYDSEGPIRKKMSLGNITITNNDFSVQSIPDVDIKNIHIVEKYLDKYGTGIYFIGNEFTKSFEYRGDSIYRNLGQIIIKKNVFRKTDIGIRSWLPTKDPLKDYIQEVLIEENTFAEFKYLGIFSPFKNVTIKDNVFISQQLNRLPEEFKKINEEGFVASAIQVAKAPWKEFKTKQGPEKVIIEGNKIDGCYLDVTPIVIQPNDGAIINLKNNTINYDSSCRRPSYDIEVETSKRKFRTRRATINASNNKVILGNQNTSNASILLKAKKKKHIKLIER